jgi:hypothetical protein
VDASTGLSSQRGASSEPALGFFGWRIGILGLAQTLAAQQEDLGVFHQAVRDRGGDRGVEEDVAPVGERCVRCNNRRAFLAVPRRDDLIEEIGGLLVEGQIAQLVTDEERRLGVGLELADQGVIDLGGQQVVEHIHGGGEEHALIGPDRRARR